MTYDPNKPITTSNFPPPVDRARRAVIAAGLMVAAVLLLCVGVLAAAFNADKAPAPASVPAPMPAPAVSAS